MAGIGIGIGLALGGGAGGAGGAALSADKSTFLTSVAAGALIASLSSPFGVGTKYETFGAVPGQLALSGGKINAGASAAAAGTSYAIGVLAVSADGMRKTGETLSFTAQAATPTPTPSASALLMSGRIVQPGFQGYTGSDGTDTDSNSRIAAWNETGAAVTKLRVYFPNWMATAVSESDAFNTINVTASIEYPAGTFTQLAFGGARSVAIANGGLGESDEATLTTAIPADAQFWIWTYVAVAAGGKWPQGYQIRTSAGEAADFTTGVDRTGGAAITNAAPTTKRRGYGPGAVKATAFTGTPRTMAVALVGDSTVMGSTDGSSDTRGNTGYAGRAFASVAPALNLGIAGTKASDNLGANFSRRMALLRKAGITHVYCGYSQNDVAAGRALATMQGNLTSLWQMFADEGWKVIQATSMPRSSSTNGFLTTGGQTALTTPAGAFDGGTGSKRSQLNAWIRTVPSPLYRCFEVSDALEPSRDAGIWRAGDGSTYLTATSATTDASTTDGIHPSVTGVNRGGIYIARDAMIAAIGGWA